MNIKTKITLGFLAVLALLLAMGTYAHYTVQRLDRSSRTILQDNFYSVQLGQGMLLALDAAEADPNAPQGLPRFREQLRREAANVTEPGEQLLVDSLTAGVARFAALPAAARPAALAGLRRLTHGVVQLNMQALTRKNEQANHTAVWAGRYLLVFITLNLLLALGLALGVPEAAVGGLRKLSASIEHAAQGNFAATIPVESRDEFGQVAEAFNRLLVHLNEFRNTNLAEVLTERHRVASIVETLDEALLLLNEAGVVLVANPPACTLLGLPQARVVGQSAERLAALAPVMATLLPLLPSSGARPAEAQPLTLTLGGEERHYRLLVHQAVSFNPVRDQVEFVGTIVALHNVSEFKRLDQAKSHFLATVSHELKTPLSTINFHLKLLQDQRVGTLSPEQQELVLALKQESQRLLKLTGTLLDVSRLESGAVPLHLQPTAPADLVAAATAPLQLQLAPKRLTLDVHVPADLPPVRADLEKTAWVLLNLLANAVRYSPEGGRIALRAAPTPDGRAVQVSVQDHGPGIAPEHQERIFQRFVQVPDASGAAPRDGSGLGLSISRDFIASQGGQLGVSSAPGAGSTFFFTLPLATGAA
ncbi:HAMP domain-containing protein [Hymenobacter sp. BT523]|uniref:HAMP domain-containing sensor histidine kinase n=1 Tax=Hymenobacter sp. BT523 TaxID=2795725 RepID=UPI0018EE0FCD|nr:ATP-binding protein [Hymenobacter sp. BT523]MBJ6107691.1 HAMP domain-containing protein [Hymenobacter sp. BT523]